MFRRGHQIGRALTALVIGAGVLLVPTAAGASKGWVSSATETEALVTPPVAPAALKVGVQVLPLWSDWDVHTALISTLAQAGVRWLRIDVGWSSYEYSGPGQIATWYEQRVDQVVAQADSLGMHILATVESAPPWAQGGGTDLRVLPTNPQDYANFMGWFANRYRGKIAAYEIWNEPDIIPSATPASYAALLEAAYPAVKAADPTAIVVSGGLSGNDAAWLAQLYAAGAGGSFDVVATHPYMAPTTAGPELADSGTTPYNIRHVTAVHQVMVDNGDGNKPIWFTEFGWSTGTTGTYYQAVTLAVQAEYLTQTLQMLPQYPYVTAAFWYTSRDLVGQGDHEDDFGLLNRDMSEKPAFGALRTWLTEHPES